MVRFVVKRSSSGSVQIRCMHGWCVQSTADVTPYLTHPGPLGFGRDPLEKCKRTAELVLGLALQRDPLVQAFVERFAEGVLRKITARRWTISTADVLEWVLDMLADDLNGGRPDVADFWPADEGGSDVSRN